MKKKSLSAFNFVFCSMNRIIFVDVPIGTVGVTIIISFFFNPLIISSIAEYRNLKSTDLLFNPTGTDTIFMSDFFEAHFPFNVAISLF